MMFNYMRDQLFVIEARVEELKRILKTKKKESDLTKTEKFLIRKTVYDIIYKCVSILKYSEN